MHFNDVCVPDGLYPFATSFNFLSSSLQFRDIEVDRQKEGITDNHLAHPKA